jgi:hypothetical protein
MPLVVRPRRSVFVREILHTVQSQLMSVALSFVRNFGFFSGASGVLGIISAGVAGASMDHRFVQVGWPRLVARANRPRVNSSGSVHGGVAVAGSWTSRRCVQ